MDMESGHLTSSDSSSDSNVPLSHLLNYGQQMVTDEDGSERLHTSQNSNKERPER